MWPMLLDFTRDECKRILRKLELEAYASVVSAFRAQGNLSKEKKKILQDLSSALSISLERHRAEVRRAVNDERLNTIADRIAGPNTSTEWAIEGRRLIPLMPRLVPQTAFTAIANNAANTQAAKNAAMLPPCSTGNKETGENSGEEDTTGKKRKRSSSLDSVSAPQKVMVPSSPVHHSSVPLPPSYPAAPVTSDATTTSPVGLNPQVAVTTSQTSGNTRTVALPAGQNPVKVTLTTAAQKFTNTISTSHTPKQVILFSTSGASISPSILQRVPIVKTVSTTSTTLTTLNPKPSPSASVTEISTVSSQNYFPTTASQNGIMTLSSTSTVTTAIPVLSTPGVSTHTVSTTTAPITSAALHKTKTKTLPPPRQHPRIRHNAVIGTQNQAPLINQSISLQLPSPPNAQPPPRAQSPSPRAHSPSPKAHSPATPVQQSSRSQSPVLTAAELPPVPQSSISTTIQTVSMSHSPAASLQIVSKPSSQISTRTHLSQAIQSIQSLPRVPVQQSQSSNNFSRSATQALQVLQSALPKVPSQVIQTFATSVRPSTQFVHSMQTTPRIPTPPLQTVHSSASHSQLKTTSCGGKTAIHFKQEGGVKIITQNVPVPTSKILPKPCGSAVVIVSCSSSTYPTANRITTVPSTGTPRFLCHFGTANASNSRISSIPSPHSQSLGTRMLAYPSSSSNVVPRPPAALKVTLPAGTLGTATIMKSTSAGVKPNVIVVHKAQLWPQGQGTTIVVSSAGPVTKLPEAVQEAVTYFQRQERSRSGGTVTMMKLAATSQSSVLHTTPSVSDTTSLYSSHALPSTASTAAEITDNNSATLQTSSSTTQTKKKEVESKPMNTLHETKAVEVNKKNTLLADLIQAAGILPDSSSVPTSVVSSHNESSENTPDTPQTTPSVIALPSSDLSQVATSESVVELENAVVLEGEVTASSQVLGLSEWMQSSHEAKTTHAAMRVVNSESKNEVLVEETKEGIVGLDSNAALSIQEISLPLEHLREGQILEIQAPDSTEILSQPGQLSKEVLELLQQAGLQIQQVEVAPAETEIISESMQASEVEIAAAVVNQVASSNSQPEIPASNSSESNKSQQMKCTSDNLHYKNEDSDRIKSEDHSAAVVDIFSTALASAQLDLDALEFVEDVISHSENLPSQEGEIPQKSDSAIAQSPSSTTSGSDLITLQLPHASVKETLLPSTSIAVSRSVEETMGEPNSNISFHSQMSRQSQSSSVVLSQVKCTSQLISSEGQSSLFSLSSQQDLSDDSVQVKRKSGEQKCINIISTALTAPKSEDSKGKKDAVVVEALPVVSCMSGSSPAVVVSNVNQSGLDTSTMNLEDFTSQQVEGGIQEGSNELLVGETLITIDQIESPLTQTERHSEQQDDHEDSTSSASTSSCPSSTPVRKKKRIIPEEQISLSPYLTGWARVASGLLERVTKFKGTGRSKGIFASHWFLHPVSPEEAPGYHEVIQQPMDFSTIKRKLENGCYCNLTEFHSDMMLVKHNCELYNPPGHEARDDCDEVFAFYLQEYNRLVEKWQKSHLLSSPKRAKTS